ncbi:MAG: globin [Sphingomonadales bacterium]|nr:globin [Sphingomonadales bacterium]
MAATVLDARAAMEQSLDAVAEAGIDIVPVVFARLFAAHPQDRAMFHNPGASEGAMVTEIMTMLLAQAAGEPWVPMMMRHQVATHHDHGLIPVERYRQTLDLFIDVLAETAGPRWLPAHEQAWRGEVDRLSALIEKHY